MKIFTNEFKEYMVTLTAKIFAYTVVFGPITILISLALAWAEGYFN